VTFLNKANSPPSFPEKMRDDRPVIKMRFSRTTRQAQREIHLIAVNTGHFSSSNG
jgi:hypothetical protein